MSITIKDLTEEQYLLLQNNNLLLSFFPNAPETWAELQELTLFKDIALYDGFIQVLQEGDPLVDTNVLFIKKYEGTAVRLYPVTCHTVVKASCFDDEDLVKTADLSSVLL